MSRQGSSYHMDQPFEHYGGQSGEQSDDQRQDNDKSFLFNMTSAPHEESHPRGMDGFIQSGRKIWLTHIRVNGTRVPYNLILPILKQNALQNVIYFIRRTTYLFPT